MPHHTLILTAGISAFTPRNVLGQRFREAGSPLVFPPGQQNPEPADPALPQSSLAAKCREWAETVNRRQPPPAHAEVSAEYSMLHAIANSSEGLSQGALVHLVHTPTLGGRLAVEIQIPLLESRLGVQCHPVELAVPFDPSQPGGLALASGAFIGQLSNLLKCCDPHSTAFAPIGGYKSMVTLGHLAASFHGFSSLYLHEDSQVLQSIAPAPIAISAETRSRVAPVARRVGNGACWNDLSAGDQHLIQQIPTFFTRVADLVELNELGQFLRLDSLPVLLSPEAAKERRQDPATLDAQLRQLATLAASTPDHPRLNHSLVSAPGRSHPWRLAQTGNGIRIAWQLAADTLLIGKIWRNHDAYDLEAAAWIQRPLPSTTTDFVPFP